MSLKIIIWLNFAVTFRGSGILVGSCLTRITLLELRCSVDSGSDCNTSTSSLGCRNKGSQTGRPQQEKLDNPTELEPGSLQSRCGQGWVSTKAKEEGSVPGLTPWLVGGRVFPLTSPHRPHCAYLCANLLCFRPSALLGWGVGDSNDLTFT